MRAVAVVAEYNPFHSGHKYHLMKTRENFPDKAVMVIMSSNYVQRGEPAIMDKRSRALSALKNGADLIIELPCVWSLSSAERFAGAAVFLAAQSGVVDNISFGAQTDDIEILKKIAFVCGDRYYKREINEYYKSSGLPFPQARQKIVDDVLGKEIGSYLKYPENILAVEYLKAVRQFKSQIIPFAVKREGASHDSDDINEKFISAKEIRSLILSGKDYTKYIPENLLDIFKSEEENGFFPVSASDFDESVLSYLLRCRAEDLLNTPDVSEGIENRIIDSVRKSSSLEELFFTAKTKRYTLSRIKRIIFNSYLGITKEDVSVTPPYLRVLGFNDAGRILLKQINENMNYPVVMRYSDLSRLDSYAKRIFELEARSQDLYFLTTKKRRIPGSDMTDEIIYIK